MRSIISDLTQDNMNKNDLHEITVDAIIAVPAVIPYLNGIFAVKTYDYFLRVTERLVKQVYDGGLGGEFKSIFKDLILGQISQAYEKAWVDDGNELPPPEYIRNASQSSVLAQFEFVDGYYKAIIDARVDGTPIDPLLNRAVMWANRYTDAYNNGVALIVAQTGGKLIWKEGDTKEKCTECLALDGIVARATVWAKVNVHPSDPPNAKISCEGWECRCTLVKTDENLTPNAEKLIRAIVARHGSA